MQVCHLIHALGAGGAERVLLDLAQVAAYGGFEMSVVSLTGEVDALNARALADLGVRVGSLGLRSRWDPRAFSRAHRKLAALQPAVVHTHLKHADIVGAFVARRLGVPQVSTLHVIEDSVSPGLALKRWVAGSVRARLADCTVAVSAAQRDWYLRQFRVPADRVVVLHNGVLPAPTLSPEQRVHLRQELGLRRQDVVAAMVAIMRPGKGHDDLLVAVAGLPAGSPLRVLLVGDGDEHARLARAVQRDDALRDRVVFAGYRNDIPELLGAVELVVHPSHADALPTALIHALSCGVPVVATDVGGIPEILGSGSARAGLLVPAHQPKALAEAMERLVADEALRAELGANGRRAFTERFEARQWAERLGELYAGLLRSGRPRGAA